MCVCVFHTEGVFPAKKWLILNYRYFIRYFYVPDTLLYVPKQVIRLLRLMNITTAKHVLRSRTKRRLLEPLRLRLTKGFVLSESLLEKLERRLA